MKVLRLALCCALFSLAASVASAQPVRVQQDPTVLTACSAINASSSAVNTTATVTITPPSGQYVYVCGIDVTTSESNTTGTIQTNQSYTSTNIGGWAYKYSMAAAVNTQMTQTFYFAYPIKSSIPGTAVTVVSPAIAAQDMFNINVYYYFGY